MCFPQFKATMAACINSFNGIDCYDNASNDAQLSMSENFFITWTFWSQCHNNVLFAINISSNKLDSIFKVSVNYKREYDIKCVFLNLK